MASPTSTPTQPSSAAPTQEMSAALTQSGSEPHVASSQAALTQSDSKILVDSSQESPTQSGSKLPADSSQEAPNQSGSKLSTASSQAAPTQSESELPEASPQAMKALQKEKIPPEKILQLLQDIQKNKMIADHKVMDRFCRIRIKMLERFLKTSDAKEEDWERLQILKDFHKEEREACKDLNFTSYFADLPPLDLKDGLTEEELIQGLEEYKKVMIIRADREEKMFEKQVKRRLAKVEEEVIKDERRRFAGLPAEQAKANVLCRLKEIQEEFEADELNDKL